MKSTLTTLGQLELPIKSCLLFACAWFLFLQFRFSDFTVDDAYISFRYAENLASGFGPVFNPGERTEGASNFLWVIVLAAAHLIGADTMAVAKLLGATLVLLIPWLLLASSRHMPPMRPNAIASWLVMLSAPLALWSVAGLETGAYTFLLTWGIYAATQDLDDRSPGRLRACIPLLCAAFMRPEGIALSIPYLALLLRRGLDPAHRIPIGRAVVAAAILFGGFAALTLFRLWFYGDLVPNTYYAKVTNPDLFPTGPPGRYIVGFLRETSTWLWVGAALLPCFVFPIGTTTAMAAGMVVIQLAFIGWVGADWMVGWRFIVPIIPALCLLAGSGIHLLDGWAFDRGRPRAPAMRWLVAAAGAAITAFASAANYFAIDRYVVNYTDTVRTMEVPLTDWLERRVPPETTIAMGDCGAVPYYTGLKAVDLLGLNDAFVARHSPTENARYVVQERNPDLILISGRGTGSEGALRSPFRLDREILKLDGFWQGYEEVEAWTSTWAYDYHLFARRGLLDQRTSDVSRRGPAAK